MFSRTLKLFTPLTKAQPLLTTQRRIHIQTDSFKSGVLTFHTLRNDPNDYQLVNGKASTNYKDNAWLQIKALLRGNMVYQFLHNSEVIKTKDTSGHTVIAGHLSTFVTDYEAKIIPESVVCMRDSSYVVDNDGHIDTFLGDWFGMQTRQMTYKVKFIDFEKEVREFFLGYDLRDRKLVAVAATEQKRQEILARAPGVVADFQKKEYIQFDGKTEQRKREDRTISTTMLMQVLQMDKIIENIPSKDDEALTILKEIFGDSLDEKHRSKYLAKTKFFSRKAATSFYEFWQTLSEDNRRTIAINQSEPLCAEIVYYQGRAYKGLGDYITARQRFNEAVSIDGDYWGKVETELSEIDELVEKGRPRP
jgi:hypothetical protein